ncbi:LOW QUALITY PROTEIN: sentrin-specific protease 7 [Oreochromis niloticus]|uniref:LOW QUALITY PROTEIN: sentrin-specific protease 7 n=1 Tax=Oreochromis niloticus TaxID=8128 RepID=UPI000DF36110|nr:LOW QUALITY PROTEIN: sentrin-specific protease 7 [Oreochromis niloticus]
MASSFKIPKKKHPHGSDSSPLDMQSPLSRLQTSTPRLQFYGNQSGRGGADRMHSGNAVGASSARQRTPCKQLLGNFETQQELKSPIGCGASDANHRAAGSWSCQSQAGQREVTSSCLSNRWRPKRASDRLLQPEVALEHLSPPQKKKELSALVNKRISVDSLAEFRGDEHLGTLSSSTLGDKRWRRVESNGDTSEEKSNTGTPPESPLKQQTKNSPISRLNQTPPSGLQRSSSSISMVLSSTTTPVRRVRLASTSNLKVDDREKERERWRQFKEKTKNNRSAVLHLRLRTPKPKLSQPTEPIVLSSEEEEDDGEGNGDEAKRTSHSSNQVDESRQGNSEKVQAPKLVPVTPTSFLQLEFASLHAGLTAADANGPIMITESGIMIPMKGVEECQVSVVASQVRGYGLWDGGVARGGTLLAGWEGPAPSLLFLWVTDAQANLLQKELSSIQTSSSSSSSCFSGPPCCFILLLLKEQLQELQAALLASILDMEEYKVATPSTSEGPASPLDWANGLLLLHSCPPPVDQHLLRLLGHSTRSSQLSRGQRNKSSLNSAGLPTRLIQYPVAPCKGRITVTKEDLACLDAGEFLNDVIIDFYLKYLLLEGVGSSVAERSHVFSSFFYKQLSRRRAAGEGTAPMSLTVTHGTRVKTWTRHVDIFTKDFLFVPVNQEAHWYLVVVCFPGLEEARYEEFQRRAGKSGAAEKPNSSLVSQQPPESSEQGWKKDTVLKRPCILVMDSLKLSYHDNVCRLIRDYLQVEWEVRRKSPRLFTSDTMKSFNCKVPQQDNSSDCGLYLLQYVESFLQNPVVHFDIPLRLESWFPRQRARQKRDEIRSLIMSLHQSQLKEEEPKPSPSR